MAFFIHPNTCLIFFRDPTAEFDAARLRHFLTDRRLAVAGDDFPLAVRWCDGPPLSVSLTRGEVAEVLGSRLMGRCREYRDRLAGCDAYVEIVFDDLYEVLDEINTLIEVQATLQTATGGLMYCSWNQNWAEPYE